MELIILGLGLAVIAWFVLSKKKGGNSWDGELLSGQHQIAIDMGDLGIIKAQLDADMAPITVSNMVKLINEGFYDGLTFHRIIKGFMVQGGDPEGTGMGGSGKNIKGEFRKNGVHNTIPHVRGTLSMARSMDKNSASSQFFIVHQDSRHLDGQYAGFGHVLEGMEVVDAIVEQAEVYGNNGMVDREKQPVIQSITLIK